MKHVVSTTFFIFSWAVLSLHLSAQSLFVPGGVNYVEIGDLDVAGNQITVEAIITKTGNGTNIVSKHTGPGNVNYLMRPGSAEITTTNGYINAVTGFNLVNGQCYHLAFTYNGSSLDYYVNGCLASSTPHTGDLVTNDFLTGIGDQSNCQCESWAGYIDEVRIWNVARTQADIQANMDNLPNPTTQLGLLAYYKFDGNYFNSQGNAAWNGVPIGNPQLQVNAACQNVDLSFQNQISTTDVSCNGGADGTVTIISTGGHPNYTYSADAVNYFPVNTIGNLPAGNGQIWASSGANSGCIEQIPITINEPTAITTLVVGTNPNCVGGNDGSADLTVSGGTPPYTFSWSSGSTQKDPTNLSAGNNTVTITDANGCTATESVLLTDPPPITTSITGTDPICNGGNDGSANLTVNNGTAPFTFNWSSGSTQEDPTNLTAGNNTVTITDVNGCTASESIVLNDPPSILPNAYANYVSSVGACDGEGVANPSGGLAPYTYLWSNGQITQVATGLCVGQHTVTVTDANGCVGSQIITVNVPACLTDVDFYTWQQAGQPANGNWVVQNAGAQVRQTINGLPTFYVTPTDYINVRMKGKMRTTDPDDDYIGVVFGFKEPLGASDNYDMWLFDWKQDNQAFGGFTGQEGMSLCRVLGTIPIGNSTVNQTFFGHQNTADFTVVDSNFGNGTGWNQNVDYEIEVTYTINRAIILVDGDTIFDVVDCFEPGRFGFYNYSQEQVYYSDFTYELFVDFQIDNDQVCAGDTAHFTFLEQCGNSNNLNQFDELQWNFGDGTSETITNINLSNVNPTHIYQNGGKYTVELIALDTLGCRDTIFKNIQIYNRPQADFTFTDQCHTDFTQFTDASTQGDFAITSWEWNFGEGPINTQPNPNYQYSAPNTYNAQLIVEDSFGCRDTAEYPVEIHVLPEAEFIPIDDCYSQNYPFTDASSIANGSVIGWQWDFDDLGSSNQQNPSYTFPSFGQYDATLIAVSDQGCGDTTTQAIILHDNPIAGFEILNICQLAPFQLTDTSSIQEGTIVSWDYDFGDGNTSTDQNPTHTYANAGTDVITQTVTSNFGCSTNVTFPATVNPKPNADFNTQDVCFNEVMNFQDATTVASGSIASWNWDFGDSNISIDQNPTNTYLTTGNFTVELITITDNACSDTIQQQVEVFELPVADFSFSNVCLDATATFTDLSTTNSGIIDSWNWDLGDATTANSEGPIDHDYQAPDDYDVELIVGSSGGCADTISQTITIYPMPVADFTADSVCFGLPNSFTDLSSISTGTINNYAWDFGFSSSSINQNPTNVFPQTGYHDVFLTITSDFGCKDTITKDIRVYVLPEPLFSHNDTCFEDDVAFVNESVISEGTIDSYNWDFGDGSSSTNQNPTHHYSSHGLYTTKLTATSNYGCLDSVSRQVEIYPLPNVAYTALPAEGCQPLTVSFDNESDIESGYFISSYQWNLGNGNSSTQENPQTVYVDSGYYDIQLIVTTTNGCDDTLQVIDAIESWPRPVAEFVSEDESYTMYFPTVRLSDLSVGASQWNWEMGDGANLYEQNPEHTYQEAGNYQVIQTVENSYGCDDTYSQRIVVEPIVTMYVPNAFTPNSDDKNEVFKAEGVGFSEFEMSIYNRWGELIFYTANMDEGWDGTYKGKQVEAGMYVYKISGSDISNHYQEYTGEVFLLR